MLCVTIDFQQPSVLSKALAGRLWHYLPPVPLYWSPELRWTGGQCGAGPALDDDF